MNQNKSEDKSEILNNAAELWEQMKLPGFPDFTVIGYLDGKTMKWSVPELLRLTAIRINNKSK